MKKRNYMFKFGLSITLAFILPIEIIVYSIFLPLGYISGNIDVSDIFFNIGIMLIILFSLFIFISLIAFGIIKFYDVDILKIEGNIISNDSKSFRICVKKEDIKYIRAKRFIFLYEFVVVEKMWWFIPSMTFYFYGKEELINFINNNNFLKKYIKEKDLSKLGL